METKEILIEKELKEEMKGRILIIKKQTVDNKIYRILKNSNIFSKIIRR